MNILTLTGVRGGEGTTTVAGMLGDALHALGQRVLLVDLNASDLLRLHFGVPHRDGHGWAAAGFPFDWRQQAFEPAPGLALVPFGRAAVEDAGMPPLLHGDDFWLRALAGLAGDFDWVLFDCPAYPGRQARALRFRSTLDVLVAQPDAAAHVLLAQIGLGAASHLLINDFEPSWPLACDVVLDWRHHYGPRVLPQAIRRDACLSEALACKQPVTRYRPDAAASRAARVLAQWCLLS
ncbi:cellulose biosynthesis protein BcsQ [Castellaniella defragrans]|uniref:Cellulose synthase operon protein YhjQ n=1 Tax=Castellaniella defragrans TaxID=75697 RepID=A0A7W9TR59_CASDE|nr:cellulose biosynthesis protein BcsQ [Castellaniella defragrans]KAB0615133.1 cellulose synthase operon protein YhjQ [Castellaniella defragrans]MBB6084508.1 cellulose synthase operon protein YhjQ [Castellaniella defragrans]